jgi:glycosyltransferase involved in cell wall biosynthesis
MSQKIVIILPAYNEEKTISGTIEEFHRALPSAEIVVVDNRSSDKTTETATNSLRKLAAKGTVLQEPRAGKANALRKAFREIDADIYVMADADMTYSAADLPALMAPVINGEADIVVGNRHANSVYSSQNDRALHNFGNNLVRGLINILFGSSLHDIMTGYRVMNYRFVKSFPVLSEGFEVETEMTLHAVHHRFALREIPIEYRKRPEGSFSKLSTFKDGFSVLRTILWIFKDYRPFPFFASVGLLCSLLGAALGVRVISDFVHTGLVPRFPSAILATGLMLIAALSFVSAFILDTVVKIHRLNFELTLLREFSGPFREEKSSDK